MDGFIMTVLKDIGTFLEKSGWLEPPLSVEFLAAGEYNENFLVTDAHAGKSVFRVNHGSQLGLTDQIKYEFRVLEAVMPSGVTPVPYHVDPSPEPVAGGALLMEFLPGVPLDYSKDHAAAADIFARIHALAPPAGLVTQERPVLDIAAESMGLLTRFSDHPLERERKTLLEYHDTIARLGEDSLWLFEGEPLCIVNTEVNSHNFLINREKSYLVDWEKAVTSCRYQDLGHFLTPTTTRWRSDYVYAGEEKRRFLRRYHGKGTPGMPFEELCEKTRILERTIILRGLSWCFMAYYEYTKGERALKSEYTFRKIKEYLSDIPWFLSAV